MTARERAPATRRQASDRVRILVAQHTSATSRDIGWVITKADDCEQFVFIDGNQIWHWTRSRRDAASFLTRSTAERWIARQLDGQGRAMEIAA